MDQVYEINGDTPSSVASLGCYEDSSSARILSSDMIRSEAMTVEVRLASTLYSKASKHGIPYLEYSLDDVNFTESRYSSWCQLDGQDRVEICR